MFLKFWNLTSSWQFFSPDDGGGGGGGAVDDGDSGGGGEEASAGIEHPEFQMPGGGDDDGGGDADDGAGVGDQPAGRRKPTPAEMIPKHRLDEVIGQRDYIGQRYSQTEAEVKKLRAIVANALGIKDPDSPAPPRELSARELAVQKRLYELIPGLEHIKDLVENRESLLGLAQSVPDFERQNKQYWDRVAKSTMTSLDNGVAAAMLGKGRTSKDLGVKAASRFRRDLFEWVQSDQERLDRYEGLDPNLVEDYVKEVDETLIAPLRRRYGADAMSRYRAVENLPVGGHSSAPVGTPKPKGKAAPDEDAAADAAWANFKERQAAAQ